MPARPTADRARRLLALLPLLGRERVALASLAATTGSDEAELAADLALLSVCGSDQADPAALVPVLIDGDQVVTFGALPALDAPTRLTVAETQAILAALDACGVQPSTELWSRLSDAVSAAVDPSSIAQTVRSAAVPGGVAHTHALLTAAAAGRRVTVVSYARSGSDSTEDRTVEPWDLFMWRGAWYLRAYDRGRSAERTFRLDRMAGVEVTGATFARPEDLTPPEGAAPDPTGLPLAEVEFAQPAFDLSERDWPGAEFTDLPDGRVRASIPYAGTDWIARRIAARLGDAIVIAPPEVRDAVAALARHEIASR